MRRLLKPGPLGLLIALVVLAAAAPRAQAPGGRQAGPNILLLYADDWRHDTLGCAGQPGREDAAPRPPRARGRPLHARLRHHVDLRREPGQRCSPGSGCRGTATPAFDDVQDAVGARPSRACCGPVATGSVTSASGTTASSPRSGSTSAARTPARTWISSPTARRSTSRSKNERDALEFLRDAAEGQAVLPDGRVLRHPRRGRATRSNTCRSRRASRSTRT